MNKYYWYWIRMVSYVGALLCFVLVCSSISFAQQPSSNSSNNNSPTPNKQNIFKDIIKDQIAIFTSPRAINKKDIKFIIPFAAATTIFLTTDEKINNNLNKSRSFVKNSQHISELGSAYAMFGTAGGLYIAGRLSGNNKIRETGLLGVEALIDSSIVVNLLKVITRRERPDKDFSEGRFLTGGQSFPSGHAIFAWTMAAVIADKYSNHPFIKYGSYGLATLVSITRVTGQKHFPSDVLVGSVVGYLIGHYVVKHHGKHP